MIEAQLRDAHDTIIAQFWREKALPISFQTKDALEIRGMAFRQPRLDTAIVISSGRTESFIKYKEFIYDLYLEGYSVFIADHRGQGLSDRVLASEAKRQIGHVHDFQDYVSDLKQFYTDFVRPIGQKKHVLLGHSMGGCIASLYLETYTQDFDAAVLCSPMDELALGFLPRFAHDIIDVETFESVKWCVALRARLIDTLLNLCDSIWASSNEISYLRIKRSRGRNLGRPWRCSPSALPRPTRCGRCRRRSTPRPLPAPRAGG